MTNRIGTHALKCTHDKLIGVNYCDDCGSRPLVVKTPIQEIGLVIQRLVEHVSIPVDHRQYLSPVWVGTKEDMARGDLVFRLHEGHPREEYEGSRFNLEVRVRLKLSTPLWRRIWNMLTRKNKKTWNQSQGSHLRISPAGALIKVDEDSRGLYAPSPKIVRQCIACAEEILLVNLNSLCPKCAKTTKLPA